MGVGQIQEDKVGFLPFNFIREAHDEEGEPEKGGQGNGESRQTRRHRGEGFRWPQLVPPCMHKPHLLPSPPSGCVHEQVRCVIVCLSVWHPM